MKRRILNLLIAIDQLLWVVFTLGNGYPDETISAAAWRMEQQGKLAGKLLRPFIDFIFSALEKDHCFVSFESEEKGRQLPDYYQKS